MPAGESQTANTVFLRLEGPLQAWGDNSKLFVRRTMDAPTKSGVLGLVCCAMGLSRQKARAKLRDLNKLRMGVRVDRPGTLWQDYHTSGAGIGILRADRGGKYDGIKYTETTDEPETIITRCYYLCDASFLVALQREPELDGAPNLISDVHDALSKPKWPVYLGRKSCPPSVPLLGRKDEEDLGTFGDLREALAWRAWRPRLPGEDTPNALDCFIEWRPSDAQPDAPAEAEVWYDAPESFDPPVHRPRFVLRDTLTARDGLVLGAPTQHVTPPPPRPYAEYQDPEYKKRRKDRLEFDHGLCVFCKSGAKPAHRITVHHTTYRRAGGNELREDLRSLCQLCHDAVTMIEYGLGMGLDRINPEDPQWRERIIAKRDEIVRFRSLETRRRRLSAEEVE
jgi:CRISPR system Cascade subunit CasD